MISRQRDIELKYGRQHIREKVINEIEKNNPLLNGLIKKIDEYRHTEYKYASKNKRLSALRMPSLTIAIELIVAVITLEVMSPIQVVVAKLFPHLKYDKELDGIKTAAEIIAVCEGKLYSLHHSSEDTGLDTLGLKPKYEISKELREFINNTKYLPPMVSKPVRWLNNWGGGNVTGSKSLILGETTKQARVQNLDTINTLQEIAWSINTGVLEFVEESKKVLDTSEKRANFLRLIQSSEQVYSDLLDQGNKFYFVWKYDFRGRSYSQGYHLNLQGNSYRKALLEFHKTELLTEEIII